MEELPVMVPVLLTFSEYLDHHTNLMFHRPQLRNMEIRLDSSQHISHAPARSFVNTGRLWKTNFNIFLPMPGNHKAAEGTKVASGDNGRFSCFFFSILKGP